MFVKILHFYFMQIAYIQLSKKAIQHEIFDKEIFNSQDCCYLVKKTAMYFTTPSDPNIFLIGIHENRLFGFGESNSKLCIYSKLIFDIGEWKEFYTIDITVVKCEFCDIGIHVAGGVCSVDQTKTAGLVKQKAIWVAARENEFTQIFSINIDTKKFIRYKMLQEIYPEFSILDLNLCCKCVNPIFRLHYPIQNFISLVIAPQKYQAEIGIFQICATINQSEYCLLWKKNDSFELTSPPLDPSSNILINMDGKKVLSVIAKSEELNDDDEEKDGRIQVLSVESADAQDNIYFPDDNNIDWIWHEIAFSSFDRLCLTRRKKADGKGSALRLNAVVFSGIEAPIGFSPLDYCTVDENFPSLESTTQFFISYRIVDKEYVSKTTNKTFFVLSELFAVPAFVVFQTDSAKIVIIPFQILSLSESAYISLSRISQPPQYQHYYRRQMPIAKISIFYYFFQRIREYFGIKNQSSKIEIKKDERWMSINFIKSAIGWPNILPLINAPNLPMYSK